MDVSFESAQTIPLNGPSASLVKNMIASLTVPTATSVRTIEVPLLDRFLKAAGDVRVSVGCIMAYAVAVASRVTPSIRNRYVNEAGKHYLVLDEATHLGIAVDDPRSGRARRVYVPAIPHASDLSYQEFSRKYLDITSRARSGDLRPEDFQRVNLIVTNTSVFGTTFGAPRLPVGPGAIIGLGKIQYPPGFSDVGEQLGIHRIFNASCTFDHRVIQGGDSGEFLDAYARTLADPAFFAGLQP